MNESSYFEKIKEYKLLAKKEVGQNFLIDNKICKEIVSLLDIKDDDVVLEIGPGAGSLSFYLSEFKAPCDLIDIDQGLIAKLQNDFSEKENIHPIVANALKADFSKYTKIISNLPYYITTSLIEKALLEATEAKKCVFMVQKEVIERLSASLGEEAWGPLALLVQSFGVFKKEFLVPRTAFVPAPHIDSCVFSITANGKRPSKDWYAFVSKMFMHRRKTTLNNLSKLIGSEKARLVLEKSNIQSNKRPEELSLGEWNRLYCFLQEQ